MKDLKVINVKVTWLLRPSPHKIKRLDEFKNEEIIAIGWPCIGNLYGKSRDQIKNLLSGEPYNYVGSRLGQAASSINIFVNKMEVGDLILMPDGDDIYFGRITIDYSYDEEKDTYEKGYSHQRQVEWVINKASRKKLSDNLRKSLRYPKAIGDLSKHFDEIEDNYMINRD